MPNYSPKLPLTRGKETSHEMLKTLLEVIKQNIRMIVLTNPGERIMIPEFGAGLYRLLFQPMSEVVFITVRDEIIRQVGIYMPFVEIKDVKFITNKEDENLQPNRLNVSIKYSVPSINLTDELLLAVNSREF